jgi:hypothetical protein
LPDPAASIFKALAGPKGAASLGKAAKHPKARTASMAEKFLIEFLQGVDPGRCLSTCHPLTGSSGAAR